MGAYGMKPVYRYLKAAQSLSKKWQAKIPTTPKQVKKP